MSSRLSHYKIVLFDLDSTLWPSSPAIFAAYDALINVFKRSYPRLFARLASSTGVRQKGGIKDQCPGEKHLHQQAVNAFRQLIREKRKSRADLGHDYDSMRRSLLTDLAAECKYTAEDVIEEGLGAFYKARNDVELYPGTAEMLQRLQTHHHHHHHTQKQNTQTHSSTTNGDGDGDGDTKESNVGGSATESKDNDAGIISSSSSSSSSNAYHTNKRKRTHHNSSTSTVTSTSTSIATSSLPPRSTGNIIILATITNGTVRVNRVSPLRDIDFAFNLTPEDAGACKPDGKIFRCAMDLLHTILRAREKKRMAALGGEKAKDTDITMYTTTDMGIDAACVDMDNVVMVGDSLSCDVEGGKAMGMRTVWINKQSSSSSSSPSSSSPSPSPSSSSSSSSSTPGSMLSNGVRAMKARLQSLLSPSPSSSSSSSSSASSASTPAPILPSSSSLSSSSFASSRASVDAEVRVVTQLEDVLREWGWI